MKRNFILAICALICVPAMAQKIRFTDASNSWKILFVHDIPYEYVNAHCDYSGDTVHAGMTYKVLKGAPGFPGGIYLLREDTMAAKVYAIYFPTGGGSGIDTTEQVLYDYQWHVGDTVTRNVSGSYKHVVSAIDSTLISGLWYKVWHFQLVSSSMGSKPFNVIEGIGCTDNPIFPLIPMSFESASILMCFDNSSGTPAVSPKVGMYFDNTTSCTLGINEMQPKHEKAIVMPDPVNSTSKIVFPCTITNGTVTIVNEIGQSVLRMALQNKEELFIGDAIKVPGMYFYQVTDAMSGTTFSGKFVHQ